MFLLVGLALAESPRCEVGDRPGLHLVLWERRKPVATGQRFGDHQAQMREQLVEQLFGNDRLDPTAQPGDLIAIFPEGFEERSWQIAGSSPPLANAGSHQRVYELLDGALADSGDSDPVNPIFHRVGSASPAELSEAIQRSVTGPMLTDWYPGESERNHDADGARQRSVSHAEVMVHHAFAKALETFEELDADCNAPGRVTLTMVSTGGRSYDVDRASDRLKGDYGWPAWRYLKHLQREVYVLRERAWEFEKLTVYDLDVRRGARNPDLYWSDGDGPAFLDLQGRTKNELENEVPARWSVALPPDLDLIAVESRLTSRGREDRAVPLRLGDAGIEVNAPALLLADLLDEREQIFGWGDGSYLPVMRTRLQVLRTAPIDSNLPTTALVEDLEVPPPEISASLNFFKTSELAGVSFLVMVLAGALALIFGFWTRRRTLKVDWEWIGGREVDLRDFLGRSEFPKQVRLVLSDPIPLLPARFAVLDVQVRLRSFVQAQVPVRDHDGFQALTAESGWELVDGACTTRVLRPVPKATRDKPLTVLTRHSQIDHARVAQLTEVLKGREHLEVVVELAIDVKDKGIAYKPVKQSTFEVLKLKAVEAEPKPHQIMKIEGDYAARCMPLWSHRTRLSPPFAALHLANEPRDEASTQTLRWTLLEGTAVYRAEQGGDPLRGGVVVLDPERELEYLADWSLVQTCKHGSEQVDLGLLYPEGLQAEDAPVQWLVDVTVRLGWSTGGEVVPMAPMHRRFRVQQLGLWWSACLDFGTSTTRVLLQDRASAAFGYLPLGKRLEGDAEDLPSEALVLASGEVVLAPHAWTRRTEGGSRFLDSIKGAVLDDPDQRSSQEDLARVVAAVLRQKVGPLLADDPVTVLKPAKDAGRALSLSNQPRKLLVATLPNDAPPAYRDALLDGVRASGLFPGGAVMLLHEAEAVALWRAEDLFASQQLAEVGDHANVLVVDYGAGTSDAALVKVWRQAHGRQKIEVLSTGGARVGGRDLDGAYFDALAEASKRSDISWNGLRAGREAIRRQMEHHKIRYAQNPTRVIQIDLPLRTKAGELRLNAPLRDVATSPVIDKVLERMARLPLAVLIGRRPKGKRSLDDVHLVVLTGRAAQSPRLARFVRRQVALYVGPTGRTPQVELPESHLLKAAVSLGARQYGRGLGGGFRPSHAIFRDRLLYLWLDERGVAHSKLLLEAGKPTGGGGHSVDALVPRAPTAWIVRTWMTPVPEGTQADPTKPWELDQVGIHRLLDGQDIEVLPGERPARRVAWDARGTDWQPDGEGGLHARVRLVIDSEHEVRVEAAHG